MERVEVRSIDYLIQKTYLAEKNKTLRSNEGVAIEMSDALSFPDYKATKINVLV
jgi:hypothetical protein